MTTKPVLSVAHLGVSFAIHKGNVQAVRDVSFELYPGETLGIVGESGSGKSVSVMSILGLLGRNTASTEGSARFKERELIGMAERQLRQVRGRHIGFVFQNPMSSLNPLRSVGWQVEEAIRTHRAHLGRRGARDAAVAALRRAGIPNAEARFTQYPHQLSGGLRQRVMIAVALANSPEILIADEPTTALDVTIQAQLLDALRIAKAEAGAATILITHDFGLIAELADRVAVMYAGEIVEVGTVEDVFREPRHPYTAGLLAARPLLGSQRGSVHAIPGQPPTPWEVAQGCAFQPRCPLTNGRARCVEVRTDLTTVGPDHQSACHFHDEMSLESSSRRTNE